MAPVAETTEVTVTVVIDEVQCRVTAGGIAGRDLRQVMDAPIGPDRDLWREAPGDGPDELVEDEQIVVIEEGVRFFTAARHITPGC